MKEKDDILVVLYALVRDKDFPLKHPVSMRELLLQLRGDWHSGHLEELVRDELINMVRDQFGVLIRLTETGWDKAHQKTAQRVS
ncbi:MAG: hypothetical protein ABW007_20135 [Chitinophagaceae bacterium]